MVMNERGETIIAIDIGRGTQDVLIYDPAQPVENSVKLVLPSPNVVVGRRIREAAASGRPICIDGHCMGGGSNVREISRLVAGGRTVFATPDAALTIRDSLDQVKRMGVRVCEEIPDDAIRIPTADYMEPELKRALDLFGVAYPENVAIAVQDHGYSPDKSNRIFRFEVFSRLLEKGDWQIFSLAPDPPDAAMSRMRSVLDQAPGALVTDTGPVAVIGALQDPWVKEKAEEGITLVNAGNGHTLAFTLVGEEICGMFEHHTAALTPGSLMGYIRKLREGTLTGGEIFNDGGHGAAVRRPMQREAIAVTGPNRARLLPDAHQASPHGDMMLTGCFGLVEVWRRVRGD
jgi:uncharacterized protein (DUF1786 family)